MAERSALITGAAKRIGRRLALGFAKDGYAVGIHCRQSHNDAEALKNTIREHGGKAEIFIADLQKPDQIETLIKDAFQKMPNLSCLVNNAAIFEKDALGSLNAALWQTQMDVNLRAPVFLSQWFAERLPKREKGVIVNLLDQKLLRINPHFFSYTISKAALLAATEMMAQALAPAIRVNAIAPGGVLADKHRSEESLKREAAGTPLGVSASVDDIWRAVRFILETPSMTGQTIALDGGAHLAWKARHSGDSP